MALSCGVGVRLPGRGPPRHDVGDVNVRSIKPDCLHHQVEQLSRAADKGNPGDIFVASRRFADEHHASFRIAVGEHKLRRGRAQHAAFERIEQRAERLQAFRALGGGARRHNRGFGRGWCGGDARRGYAGVTAPLSLAGERRGGGSGRNWRRWRNFVREAIDRLLAEKRVNPGIAVEGDQIACVFACSIHDGGFMDDPLSLCEG